MYNVQHVQFFFQKCILLQVVPTSTAIRRPPPPPPCPPPKTQKRPDLSGASEPSSNFRGTSSKFFFKKYFNFLKKLSKINWSLLQKNFRGKYILLAPERTGAFYKKIRGKYISLAPARTVYYYFYCFSIDIKHITEPWLDAALMDSTYS